MRKPRVTAKRYRWGERELTVNEWASQDDVRRLGLSANAIYGRLNNGWSVEEAVTTPKGAPRVGALEIGLHKSQATAPKSATPRASKPTPRAARPATTAKRSTGAPGHPALELFCADIDERAAELDRLEAAANALATALGLPAPYSD